jgi:hypothetical protein
LRARIAYRALIALGLFLGWLGLLLPWETWRAEAKGPTAVGADGSIGGFDASRPFWILLAVATVLAVLALWRHWRWAFVALAVAGLGLVAVAVRDIGAAVEATSAFVSVAPGAGVIVALIGAATLVAGVIVALRPPALQLAAGLTAFALVTGGAAAWPQDDGRPADGAIADFADVTSAALAFQGDTLYLVAGGELAAHPSSDREYDAATVWSAAEWSPDDRMFDRFSTDGLAFARDTAYLSVGGVDRLVSLTPDGERRMLVARPPERRRNEPPIPDGAAVELVDDFVAGPLAAGPDGSVYVLQGDSVVRWRGDRLERLAPRFGGAQDIATDRRGALYVADTANGRVHRVETNGAVQTVVGTAAERDCVEDGLDDPLALDPARCTAVRALAVDGAGNLYMALENLAMVVGLTPDGRMGVVAGTGPKGFGDGDGRAAAARLGVVEALAVGADGDLYVSESSPVDRVRRIADPAGILRSEPPEPERAEGGPGCTEIAELNAAAAVAGDADGLERALNALADAAPEDILDDVNEIAAGATDRTAAAFLVRAAIEPDETGVGLGEYAEEECGLVGGFAVPVEEANEFCVAYGRYRDQGDLLEAGEEPPQAFSDLLDATPEFLEEAGRDALRQLESEAGRVVPDAEAEILLAPVAAIGSVATAMCVSA